MRSNKKYFLLLVFVLLFLSGSAQNFNSSEDGLLRKADRYFKRDSFAAAMPLFSQLLSLHPKDPVLSYKFGVCLLIADRRDSKIPLKFLEFATGKEGVSNEIHYYLGMAYHQNYRFNEAIKEFNIYKSDVREGEIRKNDIDRKIEMCKNGKKLLNNISDLYVLERKVVNKKDFFRSYNFTEFGGKFLAKPDKFKSKQDLKMNDNSFVFYSEKNKVIYFSSYGEERERNSNRDIYRSFQDNFGEWSSPEKLSNEINTEYDEDYPFILADGKTLYFCSKGHNSMGGYDIFKTVYDKNQNRWSEPQNLDFAINTAFDDILFVSDSLQQYAYFSSTRNTAEGMLSVFKVRIDKKVKAPQVVESKVNPEQAFTIQDSTFLNFLKVKENLDVNATEDMFPKQVVIAKVENKPKVEEKEIVKAEEKQEQDTVQYDNPLLFVSNQLKLIEEEEKKNKLTMESANKLAEDKNEEAQSLHTEADSIITYSNHYIDPITKQKEINKANIIKKKAAQLEKEAQIAQKIGRQYEDKYISNQKEANNTAEYVQQIKKVQEKGNSDSSLALLSEYINIQKNETQENDETNLNDEIKVPDKAEIQALEIKKNKLENEIKELKQESDDFSIQAKNTRDNKLKNTYLSEVKERDSIISLKKKQADAITLKHEKLTSQTDSIIALQDIQNEVVAEINNISENYNENVTENKVAVEEIKEEPKETVKSDERENSNQLSVVSDQQIIEQKLKSEKEKVITGVQVAQVNLQKQIKNIENYSNNAVKIALEKNKLAKIKEKKADSIYVKANRLKNKQLKQQEENKAKTIQDEADQLKTEAIASFKISEKINDEIKVKKELEKELISEIEKINQTKDENELKQKEDIIKVNSEQANKKFEIKELALKQDPKIADDKEKEAKTYDLKAEKVEKEVKTLKVRVESIKKQATTEKNSKKKSKLLKEAESLQNEVKIKENELDNYKSRSNELITEAKNIKSISKFQDILLEKLANVENTDTLKIDIAEKENLHNELASYEKQSIVQNTKKEIPKEKTETIAVNENKIKSPGDDIINKANNRVDKIQNNIDLIEAFSNTLYENSKQKDKDAKLKGQEAQRLVSKANTTNTTSSREESLNKAAELKKDSAILIQESLVDKNVSLLMLEKIKVQKISLDSVLQYLKQIDDYAVKNDTAKEQEIYNELIIKLENKVFDNQTFQQKVASEISIIAYNKIRKSNSLISEAKKLEPIVYKANEEANKLKNDETNAENNDAKVKVHDKYIIKQQIADSVDEAVNEKYREGNQLKIEATALKTQVEYAVSLIKKSNQQIAVSNQQSAISKQQSVNSNQQTAVSKQQLADSNKHSVVSKQQITKQKDLKKKDFEEKKDTTKTIVSKSILADNKVVTDNSTTKTNKPIEKEVAIVNQIKDYNKINADNQVKYIGIKNELEEIKAKVDSTNIKDTTVKVYEYEADYYFKQATTTKNKADSSNNKNVKAKLLKDANNYELIAIDKQNKALEIYKNSLQSTVNSPLKGDSIKQLAVGNQQSAVSNQQLITSSQQTAVGNQQLITSSQQSAVGNQQLMEKKEGEAKVEEKTVVVEPQSKLEITKQISPQSTVYSPQKGDSSQQSAVGNQQLMEKKEGEAKVEEKKVEIEPQSKVEITKQISPQSTIYSLQKVDSSQHSEVSNQQLLEKKEGEVKIEEKKVVVEPLSKVEITKQISPQSTVYSPQKGDSSQQSAVGNQQLMEKKEGEVKVVVEPQSKVEIIKETKNSQQSIIAIHELKEQEKKQAVKKDEKKVVVEPQSKVEIAKQISPQTGDNSKLLVESSKQQKAEQKEEKQVEVKTKTFVDVVVEKNKSIEQLSELKDNKKQEELSKPTVIINNETVKPIIAVEVPMAGKKVETVEGIFYTIQIGVFSKPRTDAQLINLSPIFFENLGNGNYRYLSGVFDKKEDAVAAKNRVIENGIKDAFIVIYNHGKRITLADAQKLIADSAKTFASAEPFKIGDEDISSSNEILFKVQIGAYKRETDVKSRNVYLKKSKVKIDKIKNERGLIIYMAGNYKDYESAVELKTNIVKSGIKDAFIVAIKNNKKISVIQARELVKKIIKN